MDHLPVSSVSDLLSSLHWRYAVKQFDPARKIPDDHWSVLKEALVLSPSSYGLQPWKFVVVTDPQVRQQLFPLSMKQRQVLDCSHLVVFAARTTITALDISHWLERLKDIRNIPDDIVEKYSRVMNDDLVTGQRHAIAAEWAKRQVYLALGMFLASAATIGIDTCPMEGFDPAGYDEILGLPARGYTATVIATAGYRSANDHTSTEHKVRYPQDEVILTL